MEYIITIQKKQNKIKIKTKYKSDLILLIFLESVYSLENILEIKTFRNSSLLTYISNKYLTKILTSANSKIYIYNENEIEQFNQFMIDKIYLNKLNRLYINFNIPRYYKVLDEYMNNKYNIEKIYTELQIKDIDEYPIDYINVKNFNSQLSDLTRFIHNNNLYILTPQLFFYIFNIIINKNYININNNIFLYLHSNNNSNKLILFYFDFAQLKIYLIYKNINPKQIFKLYFSELLIYNRIENKLIFKYLDNYYSINVYEYLPYILCYLKFKDHLYNYIYK